jgi:diketogulonate reductase-like aldo/keto reductase
MGLLHDEQIGARPLASKGHGTAGSSGSGQDHARGRPDLRPFVSHLNLKMELTMTDTQTPPSRRAFLGAMSAVAAGLAAAPLLTVPGTALAQTAAGSPILRNTGRTNRDITALGLGTFLTFDLLPGADRSPLREVTRIYLDAGVNVIDTSPLYGAGEQNVGTFLAELGGTENLFISNKLWTTGDYLADDSQSEDSFAISQMRLWRPTMDAMFCHNLVNIDVAVPKLNAWKNEGRIGMVGVSHHENAYHDIITTWIERGQIDAVQINYSIFNRGIEERLLPAAAANGVAVFVNLAMEKARLNAITENVPLPDFAAEIGVTAWSQYFVKWAMGEPRVTTVLTATSNPEHAVENVACLTGPLPDAEMRERMRTHMEGIPGFADIATTPWYPGKQDMYAGLIRRSQAEMRERLGG